MRYAQRDIQDGEAGPWICFFIVIAFNFLAYFMNERNVLRRCCPCNQGSFLAITNRGAGIPKNQRPQSFFAWDLLDATHLARGQRVPAAVVLFLRTFNVVVFVFDILWELYGVKRLRGNLETSKLRFFTNWTFYGFGLCNLLGVAVSIKAVLNRQTSTTWKSTAPPSKPYSFLDKAFHFVYMGVAPASAALALFYWLRVYDGRAVTVDNVLKHGTSFGLLAADLLLSRISIVSYHAAIPIWYATAYAIFLWVYYDIDGTWAYEALDWTAPVRTINYFVMVVLLLLSLLLLYALAGLRELMITGKCCCMCGCCGCCGECCDPDVEHEGDFATDVSTPIFKAPNQHQFMST